jgi:hypothetical protein
MNAERRRLEEARQGRIDWKRWGPYVSERQWGTVREDYSPDGDAWAYLPHDHARSQAYRWGEDGLAGFCDDEQRLCLGLALWNGRDGILKERLFGLTNSEGNHGEDVKELYWYLDATPTSSYLRFLYKYPQLAFPYDLLIKENARRTRADREFELLDTGIFDQDRYFDVQVEYAKADAEDILLRVSVTNRGPEPAALDLLIQAWFRNTWAWRQGADRPRLDATGGATITAHHVDLGTRYLYLDDDPELLFCDNDTNVHRLYKVDGHQGYFKDVFDDYLVHGRHDAVNPARTGTKAAGHYHLELAPGSSAVLRARLTTQAQARPFADHDQTIAQRLREADEFYADIQSGITDADARLVNRQAFAGLIWSAQFYHVDIPLWLDGDPALPEPPASRRVGRNSDWRHLNNADVISMPDKWEYPWYAAWDLAFHMIPYATIDVDFAKRQLVLLLREWFMHPNGQIPAYEWNFADVNPPVHAWACWRVFQIERQQRGRSAFAFLERVFHKLLLNFTWWVNRKDAEGRNVFQGGFLGLDNIGVFNRSMVLPSGVVLDQADATAWMSMFSLNMLRIALELSLHNDAYQDIATKFFEHFLAIAEAMTNMGRAHSGVGLWDEHDEFYYDHLNVHSRDLASQLGVSDGAIIPLKVRSIVGLIPMFAVHTLEPECLDRLPHFRRRLDWFLNYRPDLAGLVSRWNEPGRGERRLLSLLRGHRLKCLLRRMLDEEEFLSPFGVRSLSRYHRDHPYTLRLPGSELGVSYVPGESDSAMFGGNSNWRGPVWLPINFLIVESLRKFHHYYGDDFKVECPARSGRYLTLEQVADEIARRLTRLFLPDEHGRRPAHGEHAKLQDDPHFRDHVLFYEHFHGDTGRGIGASHQTGWTALVASLLAPPKQSAVCSER